MTAPGCTRASDRVAFAAWLWLLAAVALYSWAPGRPGWLLVAVVGALAAGGRAAALERTDGAGRSHRALLVGVLLLGGATRLVALADLPAWLDYDSVQNGWIGTRLVADWRAGLGLPFVLTDWATGNESAFIVALGLSLDWFGVSIWALRLPAALLGWATVAATYWAGRELLDRRVGLAAAFLVAIAPWHVHLSRMAKQPIATPLATALALGCLARAERGRRPVAWRVGCGLAIGAGLHSYEAFRAFPLAVAIGLLGLRWSQGRLRSGLRELTLIAGVAAVVAAPVLLPALTQPGLYLEHARLNSILHEVAEAGSLAPLWRNVTTTLGFFVGKMPRWPAGRPTGPAPLAAVAPLFLFGLWGLLRRGPSETRWLLLSVLLVMALPFALARFHVEVPRRYGGELVPLYVLAGAGLVGLLEPLWRRGLAGRLLTALLLVALAADLTPAFRAMAGPPPGADPDREETVRYALAIADRRTVYIGPGWLDDDWWARFALTHRRIRRLETAWPLPDGPLDRPIEVLCGPDQRLPELVTWFGARRTDVDRTRGGRRMRLTIYDIDAARVAARRSADGVVIVQRPGRYGIQTARGRTEQPLGWGPAALPGATAWRPPGQDWQPLPPRWGPLRGLPPAAGIAGTELGLFHPTFVPVPCQPAYRLNRALQDLTPLPGGGWLIADLDRDPVKVWRPGQPVRPFVLSHPDGPRVYRQRYEADTPKTLSLAVLGQAVFLLDRAQRRVDRYALDGRWRETVKLPAGFVPVDLAAGAPDRVEILGRRRSLRRLGQRWVRADGGGITAAARSGSAFLRATLIRKNQRLHLTGHHLAHTGTGLGQIDDASRVSIGPGGRVVVTLPSSGQVVVFDNENRLLAPGGDPAAVGRVLREHEMTPVAAAFDAAGRWLWILGRDKGLLGLEWVTHPLRRAGTTLTGHAATGNLQPGPEDRWGPGLVIDGGVHPAVGRWSFETASAGRHQIWARYAAGERRPLTVEVDGKVVARDRAQRTGGYHARHLRWQRLAEVELAAGTHAVQLSTEGMFPHLEQLRVVRGDRSD